MKKCIKLTLLIIWLVVIYYFSSQNGNISGNLSGGLLRNILTFLNIKDVSLAVQRFGGLFRKGAHLFEYFVLGILVIINVKEYTSHNIFLISELICVLYATSDEIHQLFVDGRAFQITDIIIDSFGALIGIVFITLLKNVAKRKSIKLRNQ